MIYQIPLLIASERGILNREGEGATPLPTILRNALVLALASPGYTFGLTTFLAIIAIPSILSGAGLALILPGFSAFVTIQATRDQLVRFGHLEPPADLDEPIPDERWRLR